MGRTAYRGLAASDHHSCASNAGTEWRPGQNIIGVGLSGQVLGSTFLDCADKVFRRIYRAMTLAAYEINRRG